MKRLLAMILLPLSIVPIALIAYPAVRSDHASFVARYEHRDPLPAPRVRAAALGRRIPAHPRRVPIVVYHGLGEQQNDYTLTRTHFAAQMAALDRAGYQTISAGDYVRFARGEPVDLPAHPILITFDDGRLDSFRGADAVLAQHGFRATMFAIAGETAEGSGHFLSGDELSAMADSGRWDIEYHAGWGHRLVNTADGGREPFYAALEPGETPTERMSRVTGDLTAGARELHEKVPQARTDLFAVPFSDYGQTDDAARGRALAGWLTSHYAAWFVQADDPPFARPGRGGRVQRFEPHPKTTARALLRWLDRHAREEA